MSTPTNRRPGEKEIADMAGPALSQGSPDEHDIEGAPEVIDIDRIEKVYR